VKALTKEKEKENVLIDLELVNLKNAYLLNFEFFKKKDDRSRKREVGGGKRV
jgi:hypothetical protein